MKLFEPTKNEETEENGKMKDIIICAFHKILIMKN
jgi:hypothetical protein